MKPKFSPIFAAILLLIGAVLAQSSTPAAPKAPPDLTELVKKQFGPDFEIVTESPAAKIVGLTGMGDEPTTWSPLLTGDFNGDGVEDALIIAKNKNANIGADAYHYKVVDAFNGHFGYGNPQVTASFNNDDPLHNLILLVIHGAGKDGWHAAEPKAKFVLINIPFIKVSTARATLKKKALDAIRVDESDTISSLVVWDGKKYRYIPGGAMN
jgi:hypothetical protein